ncbi:hypothetical protein L6452_18628 [Arctium lappa]|uniref:Uncharacterized protein n=1 Tax=Arctium lappa TaxID=4217 RepID=A0ACB9C6T5_ARCLA|nr:hypothetical protein L6452_18628 [Arctium lappa]
MKGITLIEGLKERVDGTRGRLRCSETKVEDKMKRGKEPVIDAQMEKGIRIPKREVYLPVNLTVLPNISVEHIRPATLAWNVEMLEIREIEEIENGGLGSAPLLERTQDASMNNNEFRPLPDDSVEKSLEDMECEREEDVKLMDDKIGFIVAAKYDTEILLESLIAKYPGDEVFKKFKHILGDNFKYEEKDDGRANDDCGEASNKMNECQADTTCMEIVLSQ